MKESLLRDAYLRSFGQTSTVEVDCAHAPVALQQITATVLGFRWLVTKNTQRLPTDIWLLSIAKNKDTFSWFVYFEFVVTIGDCHVLDGDPPPLACCVRLYLGAPGRSDIPVTVMPLQPGMIDEDSLPRTHGHTSLDDTVLPIK